MVHAALPAIQYASCKLRSTYRGLTASISLRFGSRIRRTQPSTAWLEQRRSQWVERRDD